MTTNVKFMGCYQLKFELELFQIFNNFVFSSIDTKVS